MIRAAASLVAERGTHGTVLTVVRSAPPLTFRQTADGDTAEVHLVGTAAGPLGGDTLTLDVAVGPAASLAVRSVAASLAQPGARGDPSSAVTTVAVDHEGTLAWHPEPTIAVRGCDHRATTRITLAPTASLHWREIVVLGRHDEPSGSILQRLRVDRAGAPLLRHDHPVGPLHPQSLGPAGTAGARVVATTLHVTPSPSSADPPPQPRSATANGARAATFPLASPGATLALALGPSVESVLAALAEAERLVARAG